MGKILSVLKVPFYLFVIILLFVSGGTYGENNGSLSYIVGMLLVGMLIIGITSVYIKEPRAKKIHRDLGDWYVLAACWISVITFVVITYIWLSSSVIK